jgi:LacI family transcriptional regulator
VYSYAPSLDPGDMSLTSDNVTAGRLVAEHLLACGRSRIAIVTGDPGYGAAHDRVAGATAVLAEHGLAPLGGEALFGTWSEEWGWSATRMAVAQHPDLDAVLCGSDQVARGALDALREAGRDVPGDVAVTGHDNWEILATNARPPLTTIDMNLEELGRRAAARLFDAIDGTTAPGVELVPCRLVPRGSTGAPGRP